MCDSREVRSRCAFSPRSQRPSGSEQKPGRSARQARPSVGFVEASPAMAVAFNGELLSILRILRILCMRSSSQGKDPASASTNFAAVCSTSLQSCCCKGSNTLWRLMTQAPFLSMRSLLTSGGSTSEARGILFGDVQH